MNSTNSNGILSRSSTIANLRRALDALVQGKEDEARMILENHHCARAIASLEPAFASADSAVVAAYNLYLEALQEREAVIRSIRARHGSGPFLLEEGRTVTIVTRTRGDRERLFLRTVAKANGN